MTLVQTQDLQSSIALVFAEASLSCIEQTVIDLRMKTFKGTPAELKERVARSLGISLRTLYKKFSKRDNKEDAPRQDITGAIVSLCRSEMQMSAPQGEHPLLSIEACPLTFLFTQQSFDEVRQAITEYRLDHLKGNKTQAAKSLSIALKTLYNRLNQYGYCGPERRQFIDSVFTSLETLQTPIAPASLHSHDHSHLSFHNF